METLRRSQQLLDDLKTQANILSFIEEKLEAASGEYSEELWKQEFEVAVDISSIYEDLMDSLDRLENEENMVFLARRMRQQANEIVQVEYV